jgi:hypothetical protein
VSYLVIGLVSGALAGSAASTRIRDLWRQGAFVASAIVFAAHIWFGHFRLRRVPRDTAWHAGLAVALGGLGLALAANIHDLQAATGYRPRMLIALVAWPLLTCVPAFLVVRVAAAGLAAKWPRS